MRGISAYSLHGLRNGSHVSRVRCLGILGALVLLAACGGTGGVVQTVQTARYRVQLRVEESRVGNAAATIEVRDVAGQPVAVEDVVVAPTMKSMGMASPEVTAQQIVPGRYHAEGITLSMAGDWELDVRVAANGSEDTATFILAVST